MRFLQGTNVTHWGHTLGLCHPDSPGIFVETRWLDDLESLITSGDEVPKQLAVLLGDLLAPGDAYPVDNKTLERMAELDRLYLGWVPGLWQRCGGLITGAQRLAASCRIHERPRHALPSLPASTAHRASVIASLDGEQILVLDDPDGLSLLLAQNKAVTVVETNGPRRRWLESQANRCNVRLTFVESLADAKQADIVVVSPSDPRLFEACALARPGGIIVATVHPPWGKLWKAFATDIGLEVFASHREVEYVLLPGGRVFDAAGDLVLHQRVGTLTPTRPLEMPSTYWLDIDSPAHTGLQNPCEHLADALAGCAPWPEANRSLDRVGERDALWWSAAHASGLVAELWRERQRLLVTISPFSPELSFAAMAAVSLSLCDDSTRFRAHHGRWQMQNLSTE